MTEQLGEGAGQLDARGPAADHDDGHEPIAFGRVLRHLGPLDGGKDAPPDVDGIVDRLQAEGVFGPLRMAEVGRARTGGDDEIVEGEFLGFADHLLARRVDPDDLVHQHRDVGTIRHDGADGLGDVRHGQTRRGHLVEQRLEKVVVRAVKKRDAGDPRGECAAEGEASEAAADHDDVGNGLCAHGAFDGPKLPAGGLLGHYRHDLLIVR